MPTVQHSGVASRYDALLIFFFNDTATTEIYTLSLHDALPISLTARPARREASRRGSPAGARSLPRRGSAAGARPAGREGPRLASGHQAARRHFDRRNHARLHLLLLRRHPR